MSSAPMQAELNNNLSDFKLDEVLNDSPDAKSVTLLGSFEGKPGQAIVTLARRHFDHQALQPLLQAIHYVDAQFCNDIYSKFTAAVPTEHGQINVDVTYPATEKHIRKARKQEYFMVRETPETYAEVTLPYMQTIPAAHIQWVYNILERKAEAERLLFEDSDPNTGFMLHPDLKWDQAQPDALYCIAISHMRTIRSLRDLTAEHLPLLRNIRDKSSTAIQDKWGVGMDRLRFYVHYQPSYYHFHVHVVHVSLPTPGAAVGKAHLLDDVIDNLATVSSDYYQKRTLTYSLGGNDGLMEFMRKRRSAVAAKVEENSATLEKKARTESW